ncbi:MAG: hypothetical protein Q9208_003876 [Pyrenodesmia sp. 3 TL-2023]
MPTATRNLTPSGVPPLKSLLADPQDHFRRLVKDIQITLGSENGIAASDAVRRKLQDMLQEYQSDEVAWQKYAFRDPTETFTRNLVDRGNGNYNLILRGTLTETRYAWPSLSKPGPMQVTQSTDFHRDEVTYMADTLGLHKISNPNPSEYAVSLHWKVYTPPNAAIEGCKIFNAETGQATHVKVYEYYSEFGRRCSD